MAGLARSPTIAAPGPLLPALADPSGKEALRFGERALSWRELAGAAGAIAARVRGARSVGVWAAPALETAVVVVGALLAGVPVVPLNPRSGERERAHVLGDAAPDLVLGPADVDVAARAPVALPEPDGDAPALIVYTSGTTGPPKGVVLPRRAIAANLDALADAWAWTADDVLVHALPLFHVHGLVLGVLGPLRRGGTVHHVGSFSSAAVGAALAGPATMLFGVPTMYHRLAADAERDPAIAAALARARLLVSGSAALPVADHERIERACGRRVIERYGMTETLMICAQRVDDDGPAGSVGPPLPGVELRLVDDDEIQVRGPSLFSGYLNRPDATAAAMDGDWFRTGDVGARGPGGALRIVGRRATDLIKSGGFKLGAGEIEAALLEHPGVAEAAVTGEPDADLGERVVAWIVPAPGREPPGDRELADHVARLLSPHKRPRVVRRLDALPRNELGKVVKARLEPALGERP